MKKWKLITYYTLLLLCIFLVGVVTGMLLGTYALIDHAGTAFNSIFQGATITINVNETKLVEEFNKTITPEFSKILNHTGARS